MIMHACRKVEEASLIKCKVLVIHHWLSRSVHLTKLLAAILSLFLFFCPLQSKELSNSFSLPHTTPIPIPTLLFKPIYIYLFIYFFLPSEKRCQNYARQFDLMFCIQSVPVGLSKWPTLGKAVCVLYAGR